MQLSTYESMTRAPAMVELEEGTGTKGGWSQGTAEHGMHCHQPSSTKRTLDIKADGVLRRQVGVVAGCVDVGALNELERWGGRLVRASLL